MIRIALIVLVGLVVVAIAIGKFLGSQWRQDLEHDFDVWSRPFPKDRP